MPSSDQIKVRKSLEALARKARAKAIRSGLRQGCKLVAAKYSADAPRDTGKLAESPKVRSAPAEPGQIGIDVVVGDPHEKPVAYWVEFGTSKMPPNPVFRHAIHSETSGLIRTVEDAFRSVVE